MIKLKHWILSSALLAMPFAQAASFDGSQTQAIEHIVHQYLLDNPEVLVEASQAYKSKQMTSMKAKASDFIAAHKKDFFSDKSNPVAGNSKGNVTLVEFFDYQCGHCKEMAQTVHKLAQEDKNLRIVFKQLPIFKGGSIIAAKAALAAGKQGKFVPLHEALLEAKKPLTEDNILAIAKTAGLDITKLKKDMGSDAISKQIDGNMKLAQSFLQDSVGYVFTPIFVVGNQSGDKFKFIPGGLDYNNMKKVIKDVRS